MNGKSIAALALAALTGAALYYSIHYAIESGLFSSGAQRGPQAEYVDRQPQGYTYTWTSKDFWEQLNDEEATEFVQPGEKNVPTIKSKPKLLKRADEGLRGFTDPLVLLVIDETKVKNPMVFIRDTATPHALGDPVVLRSLNIDAVVHTYDFERDATGKFRLPDNLPY